MNPFRSVYERMLASLIVWTLIGLGWLLWRAWQIITAWLASY
jgi:hypothetical protein